jgi:hypothetical protein
MNGGQANGKTAAAFEQMMRQVAVLEPPRVKLIVSHLCPPGSCYIMDLAGIEPEAPEVKENPDLKALVVGTDDHARRVREAAAATGVTIVE